MIVDYWVILTIIEVQSTPKSMEEYCMIRLLGRSLGAFAVGAVVVILSANAVSQTCVSDPEVVRQRRILANLTPASKAAVWKQHLSAQLKTRSFTSEQKRVIMMGLRLTTEERYRANPERARREEMEPNGVLAVYRREIRAHFAKEDVLSIFNRIEPIVFNAYISSQPTFMQVRFEEGGNCTCLVEAGGHSYECLGTGGDCYTGIPGTCTMTPGCGSGGLFHCNGKCSQFPEDH